MNWSASKSRPQSLRLTTARPNTYTLRGGNTHRKRLAVIGCGSKKSMGCTTAAIPPMPSVFKTRLTGADTPRRTRKNLTISHSASVSLEAIMAVRFSKTVSWTSGWRGKSNRTDFYVGEDKRGTIEGTESIGNGEMSYCIVFVDGRRFVPADTLAAAKTR